MSSLSVAVSPGNPTLASEGNNIRLDAIALALDCTAGEAYAATFTKSGITLPTLLYQQSNGKWYKATSATLTAGYAQIVGMAYNLSTGDGAAVKVIMPGAYVTGSGMTLGQNLFPSDDTAGAMEVFDGPNMIAYKLIGAAVSATDFYFFPTSNTTLPMELRSYFTSGEALTRGDLCYIKQSDGRAYKAIATAAESGFARQLVVAQNTTGGAGNTVLCSKAGSTVAITGTFTAGLVFVGGTAGQVSNTRGGKFNRCVGIALDTVNVYLMPLQPEDYVIVERVTAFENWAAGDLLYKRASDGFYGRADSDVAESGIGEFPAIAVATHTGGSGTVQLVYMPGSILKGVLTGTRTQRVWPSPTPGAFVTTHPATTVFFRKYGHFIDTDVFAFHPGELEFLPTGIQEQGNSGGSNTSDGSTAGIIHSNTVNFRRVMVNAPSSVTFSVVSTTGTISVGPDARNITRWGFRFYIQRDTAGDYMWTGSFTTVGN